MNDDFLNVSLLQWWLHWLIASPHNFLCSENQPPVGNFSVVTEVSQVTLAVDWLVTVTLGAPHPQRVWVGSPPQSGYHWAQSLLRFPQHTDPWRTPSSEKSLLKTPSACSHTYFLFRKQ